MECWVTGELCRSGRYTLYKEYGYKHNSDMILTIGTTPKMDSIESNHDIR